MRNSFSSTITRVGIVTIFFNVVLCAFKIIMGILSDSSALISDGVHSGSDVFTTIIVIIGAKIAMKARDMDHSYGHERFESIVSVFLGVVLAGTAIGIGYDGINTLINYEPTDPKRGIILYLSIVAAVSSIVIKGWMFFYTARVAKTINSTSLKADAWHHLSDSLSSIGSLLGVGGMAIGNGFEMLDPIAAIVICLVIIKVAVDIEKSAINQLVDKSIDKKLADEIEQKILQTDGVLGIKSFMSRIFGNKMYLDVIIFVDSSLSLKQADDIGESVHHKLEADYIDIKHCSITVKPKIEDIDKSDL